MTHSTRAATLAILALGTLLTGCQPEFDGEFRHRSMLQRSTRGLVLNDIGTTGHAGMMSSNCPFETDWGLVTGDYNLPGEDEEVQDIGSHVLGSNSIMLVIPGFLHVLNIETGEYLVDSVEVTDAVGGRFYDQGLVALVDAEDGCSVEWIDDDGNVTTAVVTSCAVQSFDVDPLTGTTYLGNPDGTLEIVTPDGSIDADTGGDLVAWDPAAVVTYVATLDSDTVEAIEPDGTTRWISVVNGTIQVLASAGGQGAAAVMLEKADGSGLLVYLDGWTGEEITELETPSAATGLSVSADGGTLAMTLVDETHFYGVHID